MKVWEIIGLILSLLFIVFNRKIRLWKIFVEQFKVYKNDKTQKTSCFDIVSFIVSPIVLSVLIARLLPYKDVVESSGTIITVFSSCPCFSNSSNSRANILSTSLAFTRAQSSSSLPKAPR